MMNSFDDVLANCHSGVRLQRSELVDAFMRVGATKDKPEVILCGPAQYAMIQAYVEFQGRDRRRIKREVNKAARNARRESRV